MASYTKPDPPKDDETYTRKNAWNNGGTFSNPDLEWYAKGVGEMMSRSLDDPNSWWFFAAIHGEYITGETSYPGWGFIPGPPQVPTTPVPSQSVQDQYWDQCQHQSWYFPPWHRGYLLALEAQIREAIVSLGGPSTWALPYWNYFGPSNQYEIPPAFTQQTLPDGTTPNPLFVEQRFGPNNDGNIFIPIPPVSEACENNTIYTGSNSATRPPGFGGPQTGFAHGGGVSGNLESNPHNQVHVYVGGNSPDGQTWGLMSDPGIAALDPIFYLHHSNIDRMWAAWNANGNPNTTDPNWLGGPASTGGREFVMPMPGATPWVYTPDMVKSLSQLDYVYDDLTVAVSAQPSSVLAQRLNKLGAPAPSGLESVSGDDMDSADNAELVGANSGPLEIKSSGARANVKLDPDVRGKVSDSLEAATDTLPDRVYLQLENVRGTRDAYRLTVSVNQKRAGSVALFGLRRASLKDGEHGGEGLTYVLDITDIIDDLFLENSALDLNSLDVRIVPNQAVADEADLSIGRISVYRQGQQ